MAAIAVRATGVGGLQSVPDWPGEDRRRTLSACLTRRNGGAEGETRSRRRSNETAIQSDSRLTSDEAARERDLGCKVVQYVASAVVSSVWCEKRMRCTVVEGTAAAAAAAEGKRASSSERERVLGRLRFLSLPVALCAAVLADTIVTAASKVESFQSSTASQMRSNRISNLEQKQDDDH